MNDFDRIFGPRLEKAVKAISLLANGVRYEPSQDQLQNTIAELETALLEVRTIYGVKQEEVPAPDPNPDPAPVSAPVSARAPEGWKHDDIRLNVTNIPANQLSSYATQIIARLCERFDTEKDGW